jgi:hypothetical protein
MSQVLTIAGASVVLLVNDVNYGRVIGIDWDVTTPIEELRGVDSPQPYELANSTTSVGGTLSVLRTLGDGGAEGAGMTAPLIDVGKTRYVSLTLLERRTQQVLFQTKRAAISSQSWTVPLRGIISGTITFISIDYSNEVTS